MSEDLSSLRKALARLNVAPEPAATGELAARLIATGIRYRHVARHLEECSTAAHSPAQLRMLENADHMDECADQCHREALNLLEPGFAVVPGVACPLCSDAGVVWLASKPEAFDGGSAVATLSGPCLCRGVA